MYGKRILIIVLAILVIGAIAWFAVRDRVMWSTGSRLAWHQDGVSGGELSQWRWEVRVDSSEPVVLAAACTPASGSSAFDCEASLPSMSWGTHVVEFRSWHTAESGPQRGQSLSSQPSTLNVIVLPRPW